jgi:hypothetical protein
VAEDWAAIAADVAAALGEFQPVTITEPAVTQYDPATDTTVVVTPAVEHGGSGVELKYDAQSVAAGLVAAGDVRFLLSPLKTNGQPMPRPVADSWTLTKADGVWTIKRVTPTSPAGVDVLLEVQLRKS